MEKNNSHKLTSEGSNLIVKLNFLNPGNVAAGNYSGNLFVASSDIGTPLTIPVVVQVRWPGWLAWVLIILGVLLALFFQWWNDKGKRETMVQSRAEKLRHQLDQFEAYLPKKCYDDVSSNINKALSSCSNSKLDDAEKTIQSAEDSMETCLQEGRAFQARVAGLHKKLDNAIDDLHELQRRYGDGIQKTIPALESIAKKIRSIDNGYLNEGLYSKPEATANLDAEEANLSEFSGEKGVIDVLKWLAEKRKLEGKSPDDIKTEMQPWLSRLILFEYAKQAEILRTDIYEKNPWLKPELIQSGVTRSSRDMGKESSNAVQCLILHPTSNQKAGKPVVLEAIPSDKENDKIEYLFTVEMNNVQKVCSGWTTRNKWVWTPEDCDVGEYNLKVMPRDSTNHSSVGNSLAVGFEVKEKSWTDWFSPDHRLKIVGIGAYVVVILGLGFLGYSTLYESNPTFGAGNVYQEYLYLFLWGFGIQSGMATVAGFSNNVLGAKSSAT
jgi:hypothetical protein